MQSGVCCECRPCRFRISCDDSVSATITISAEEKSGQSANMGSSMKMCLRLYMGVVRLVKMSILMARVRFNCEF